MKWANFLHLYQPPTQAEDVLESVVRESYELIIKLLEKYPKFCFTLNISGSLLELLEKYKHNQLIENIKKYSNDGRIELVGSAMYHALLPLLPTAEIERQIDLDTAICQKFFGEIYKPTGFFMPEMAYSKKVADIVRKKGFSWVILDEIHSAEKINPSCRYTIKNNGLMVVFRNRIASKTFPPEYIENNFNSLNTQFLVTAHDGELYGHWHKDDRGFYEKTFTDPRIEMLTISKYISMLENNRAVVIRNANWESTPEELAESNPYALWRDRRNHIHRDLWKLLRFSLSTVSKHARDPNFALSRKYLDRGLASCYWWWASGRKLGDFSPITWHPSEIEKGANEMLAAVRSLKSASVSEKLNAEKIFNRVRNMIWKKHWQMEALANNQNNL